MSELTLLREALEYAHIHRDKAIVIKLGRNVLERLDTLGVINDIKIIKDLGIRVIIAHDIPEVLSIESLVSMRYGKHKESIFESVKAALEGIPMFHCHGKEGLSCDEEIAELAVAHKAEKLVFLTHIDGIFGKDGFIGDLSLEQAKALAHTGTVRGTMRNKLLSAIYACEHGVPRTHIINGTKEGSLIVELFTCKGFGTMVFSQTPYHEIRKALTTEFCEIAALLQEQDSFSTLVIPAEIIGNKGSFLVFAVDGQIQGCMRMNQNGSGTLEVSYLAVSSTYNESDRVVRSLLEHAIDEAQKGSLRGVCLDAEKNPCWLRLQPWFFQLGFKKSNGNGRFGSDHGRLWVKEFKEAA